MTFRISPGVCINGSCNGRCSKCHPEDFWNWGYASVNSEFLDDLNAVYPGLFNIISQIEAPLFETISIQFRCEQLPPELIGEDVRFTITRVDQKPIVTFIKSRT